MAAITISDYENVLPVEGEPSEKWEQASGAVITPGQVVRQDTTTGKWVLANATSTGNAGKPFIAFARSNVANLGVIAMRRGYLFLDTGLDSLAPGALIYLSDTDGGLSTTAGTVSVILGFVMMLYITTSGRKIMKVECP